MPVKIINFKKYQDPSGDLIPFYTNLKGRFPFNNRRIFLVYGKKNYKRSDHAHKSCKQLLVCINGSIKIVINKKKIFKLDSKNSQGLLVPKLNWSEIFFLKKKSILMVFCDKQYSAKEYIRSYSQFLKIKKKK
jgi:UDP-2-acetamido-3-amino-2,3-dideoxy-glucuronate N-acetyltransferase